MMNTLSIILVFVFLGALVISGVFLIGFGVRKLQRLAHVSGNTGSKAFYISLDILIVAVGLLLVFYGTFGGYRIVWGS